MCLTMPSCSLSQLSSFTIGSVFKNFPYP
jgi:hypothetical protein